MKDAVDEHKFPCDFRDSTFDNGLDMGHLWRRDDDLQAYRRTQQNPRAV